VSWSALTVLTGLDHGGRAERSIKRLGVAHWNPLVETAWVSRGKKIIKAVQLFPGYIFVESVTEWRALVRSPGVTGVISDGDGPLTIPGCVIEELKARAQADGLFVLPKAERFVPGQKLAYTHSGSEWPVIFEGMSGFERCAVLMKIFNRYTRVVVPEKELSEV
jgi:transcription antitermination factor NusG